jgi:hypothetical protein
LEVFEGGGEVNWQGFVESAGRRGGHGDLIL